MKELIRDKQVVCAALAAATGLAAFLRFPFPDDNNLLHLIFLQRPTVFHAINASYLAMLFTTPYLVFSILFALGYIFLIRRDNVTGLAKLPPYPDPAVRDSLFVVIGEVHHPKKPEPVENPRWLMIPDRGLFTGIAVFGAIGSGKTSGCMYPFADQLLAFRATDPEKRIWRLDSGGERRLLSQGANDTRTTRPQ